ncbi:MAG TPA: LacI family DNA-binding transcriptional regulator [Candidatus Eisenbergiella merdipullorum]|uniref:LacI family DNA-binding transcriptional regulator n=1 Tax=Candidatus Eisenbergiella merdipullorum TaxID=2838553 RepID=A0A9D2L0V1_9FIRM|nr:LacI family DNA-binding transcriptional regulator [Candidatus Eisenbergiella merdipullorum]
MATIKQVAAAAGVSVATVSRYFNTPEQLSEQTRERVRRAVEQLTYYPSALGRNLRTSQTRKILVILPTISNPFYSRIITGMEEVAEKNGYSVLTCTTGGNPESEKNKLKMLYDRFVDGAVFFSTSLSRRQFDRLALEYPVVQCCEYQEGSAAGAVSIDNEQAAYEAVRYLLELGHRRVALVNSNNRFESSILREKGYRRALKEYGLSVREEYIRRGTYGFHNGEESLHHFLSLKEPPTAVFTVADSIAVGVIHAALEQGLQVGKAYSVIGFDDTSLARMYRPGITSVAQPRKELGEAAARLLLRRFQASPKSGELIFLPHRLVIRESTEG